MAAILSRPQCVNNVPPVTPVTCSDIAFAADVRAKRSEMSVKL